MGLSGGTGVFSSQALSWPDAAKLLGASRIVPFPPASQAAGLHSVACFEDDASNGGLARRYAHKHGLPSIVARPALLRSVGIRGIAEQPLGLWLDETGDPCAPDGESSFERGLSAPDFRLSAEVAEVAERCMEHMQRARLSRDNHSPTGFSLGPRTRPRILVVDELLDCALVALGKAGPADFTRMLDAAMSEHPDAEIVISRFADAWSKPGPSHLGKVSSPRVRHAPCPPHPADLLAEVDGVYVVTSTLGMEALIAGKPVTCFGMPFFAGWGLTDDRSEPRRHARARSLTELFAAAYLLGSRYVHPDTHELCALGDVLEYLALQRGLFEENRGDTFAFGFMPWKFGYVRAYLRSPGTRVRFPCSTRYARLRGFGPNSRLLVWGTKDTPDIRALGAEFGVPVWRMEDGFLRSVGLGSDRTVPASLVVDRQGIYFDPAGPSDLETILQTAVFSAEELARAQRLRALVVAARVSKYNVGDLRASPQRKEGARRVILVPGQVEDDASIQRACVDVRTNEALLRTVRANHPDAYVIFKPHPDVSSGNRVGNVAEAALRALADEVVVDAPLPACLDLADEVHTMTSLVGFEALMRGLVVHTYGRPFYAGWGLTHDRYPIERRTRTLTLDELVAGTLLRYPRYFSSETGLFTTPEHVTAALRRRLAGGTRPVREPFLWRKATKAWNAVRGMLDAF